MAAALVWGAVNGPVALAYHDGWWEFYKFSQQRPTERSTVWAMGRTLWKASIADGDAPYYVPSGTAVALALLAALALVAAIGLMAPTRPRLGQLAFLCVLAFLLTTKVWSPQYSLWLLPLAVLARPSWRVLLAWQVTECLVWIPRLLWFLGTGSKGVDYSWFFGAVLLRDAAVLALAALVVRDILRPAEDIVRAPERLGGAADDDPAGGVLDRAGAGPDLIDGDDSRNAT